MDNLWVAFILSIVEAVAEAPVLILIKPQHVRHPLRTSVLKVKLPQRQLQQIIHTTHLHFLII